MNDFTMKELIALEDAMQNMLDLHPPQSKKSPLLEKLQLMIDNYCEHPDKWGCATCRTFICEVCDIRGHKDKA